MVLSPGAGSCQPVRPSTGDAVGELHTLVGLFAFWPGMAWSVETCVCMCVLGYNICWDIMGCNWDVYIYIDMLIYIYMLIFSKDW